MGGFLVAFFLQSRSKFLYQLEFDEGGEIGDAAYADEGSMEFFGRLVLVLKVCECEG